MFLVFLMIYTPQGHIRKYKYKYNYKPILKCKLNSFF